MGDNTTVTFTVTDPAGIEIDGARAYNFGDEIAPDVVEAHGLQAQVEAQGAEPGQPLDAPTEPAPEPGPGRGKAKTPNPAA